MQHRQADALERQAEELSLEIERQLIDRREGLTRATTELAALQEQSTQAARATEEEVEAVRDRLREAKAVQTEVRDAALAATGREEDERRQLKEQTDTLRKLLAARQAASAELAREVDDAAARRARLEAKRRDLERLLGLLPGDSRPEATDSAPVGEKTVADDIDVDLGDEPGSST